MICLVLKHPELKLWENHTMTQQIINLSFLEPGNLNGFIAMMIYFEYWNRNAAITGVTEKRRKKQNDYSAPCRNYGHMRGWMADLLDRICRSGKIYNG